MDDLILLPDRRRALRCWALSAGESLASESPTGESLAVSAAAGALQIVAEEGVADRVVKCQGCYTIISSCCQITHDAS